MSMVTSVPDELPREVLPCGLHNDDHFIPAGIRIGTNGYSLLLHDQVFGGPGYIDQSVGSFMPEKVLLQMT